MGKSVIGSEELLGMLSDPDLRVLDASWHLPDTGRDAAAEFAEAHVPGALFLDMATLSDPAHELPDMLPPAELFAERVGGLGVGGRARVVVYDTVGIYSAARAWWMFRAFGHEDVLVLDGGLVDWRLRGLPLEAGVPAPRPAAFEGRRRPELVADWRRVLRAATDGGAQVVDARMPDRFHGRIPDPYDRVRPGHVPGSRNVYWQSLLSPGDRRLLGEEGLREAFEAAGVEPGRPVIATCGSGVAAAVVALALTELGRDDWSVYDGSWNEWGRRDDLPVAR
jgi:thiosulfate/3-mercaptopyruvate sulfurtransferase